MQDYSLLFGEKGHSFCEKFFSLHHRFPAFFPKTALKELACFLSQLSDPFLEFRSHLLLSRIFFALHRLITTSNEQEQRLHLRSFQIGPSIFGTAIAFFPLDETERLSETQILKAVQNLIPGVLVVPNSYFSYKYQTATLYYLEIKKVRGIGFSKLEKQKLQIDLLQELQNAVESISHSLFLPGNEEELFKNIRHLSKEIKYLHDLPQVMITFVEYFQETLKFLVIALRVIKPTTPSFITLSTRLPSSVQFSLEKIFCVGRLRKKYPKEAAIFTLEVQSSLFSRNNQALNLRSARLYIVKAIEGILGPFRDYNGGLLNKENEQLLGIKSALESKEISCAFLEDLFYNIKPMEMRALLSVEMGIELAVHFQKMLDTPLDHEKKYCQLRFENRDLHLAIIKTKEKGWKTSLPPRILLHAGQVGCSIIEREGYLYFCFFHQYADGAKNILFDTLDEELTQHTTSTLNPQKKLLRLNFQSGNPLSLNPRLAADMPCHILCNLLFEGLTCINEGKRQLAAAEKIDVSECGTSYTFHLRKACWSNGEEVTAYHFEKAWKKALIANNIHSPYPDFFYLIKNVQQTRKKLLPLEQVGIKVKDSKTLHVTLERPCSYFLDLCSTPPFFPMLGDAEEPSDFNGPFTITEWKQNSSLHLSQNPFYRDAQNIKLGGVKIFMIRDPYLGYEMFQKKELDFYGDPISPLPPELLRLPEIQKNLVQKPISRIFWIHLNLRIFPFNNVHFRRSLSLAIDRKQIVDKVFISQIPQLSPLPSKYTDFHGQERGDPKLARLFFEKALKELNCERSAFPTLVMTHSDLSFEKPLFEELKAQWKEVLGIDIVSQNLRWNEFSAAIEKGNFQLCGLFRRDFFNNPLFYLSFFKASPMTPHSLDNQEYERLYHLLERGENKDENLKKMESILIEETPVISLINQQFLALIANRVKGVKWQENGCLDLKEVRISEKDD